MDEKKMGNVRGRSGINAVEQNGGEAPRPGQVQLYIRGRNSLMQVTFVQRPEGGEEDEPDMPKSHFSCSRSL